MRSLNVFKIISILAFLSLAGFSCYWTAESLFIWQPSITIYGAWLIAAVFYVIASICFGNLLKSLDKRSDYYGKLFGRTGAFVMAFLGLMVFWLFVSLPTNTHTLLYRASIKDVITTDLNRTQGYLQNLKDNNVEIKKIEQKYNSKSDAVDALLLRLLSEIDNPSAFGIGDRFDTVLAELDRTLSVGNNNPVKLQRVTNVGKSRTQWLTTLNYYQQQAYEQLRLYRLSCDKEISRIKETMGSKELAKLIANNKIALKDISKMNNVSNAVVEAAMNDLIADYAFIKANAQYIQFKDEDRELYTRDGAMPEAKTMLSVPDVWKTYATTDKFAGKGFEWWIIIALLVDISGFIFFNMAFNGKQNNAI
ncbi:MAG: hypothetical protein HDR46_05255 [Bacteroides sp.]|nr:hypothetical protein [Bacteroides sp.]